MRTVFVESPRFHDSEQIICSLYMWSLRESFNLLSDVVEAIRKGRCNLLKAAGGGGGGRHLISDCLQERGIDKGGGRMQWTGMGGGKGAKSQNHLEEGGLIKRICGRHYTHFWGYLHSRPTHWMFNPL